jgi:hypothetical protein
MASACDHAACLPRWRAGSPSRPADEGGRRSGDHPAPPWGHRRAWRRLHPAAALTQGPASGPTRRRQRTAAGRHGRSCRHALGRSLCRRRHSPGGPCRRAPPGAFVRSGFAFVQFVKREDHSVRHACLCNPGSLARQRMLQRCRERQYLGLMGSPLSVFAFAAPVAAHSSSRGPGANVRRSAAAGAAANAIHYASRRSFESRIPHARHVAVRSGCDICSHTLPLVHVAHAARCNHASIVSCALHARADLCA